MLFFFVTKIITCSHCMDAFSLGLPHIILLDLVQILIVLSLIMSGKYSILTIIVFVAKCTIHWTWSCTASRFLGTSGQNVDDLENYSDAKDKLEFMEKTLRWRHLAPTAPNTLGMFIMYASMLLLLYYQ